VIDVAVGVHDRVQPVARPTTQGGDDLRTGLDAARVEHDEPVVRVDRDDVGVGLDEGHARRQLRQLVGDPHRWLDQLTGVDHPRRQLQDVQVSLLARTLTGP